MSVKEEELLEEISGFLHGYLKAGKVKINSFLSKVNLNISNLEQLLTIRFLLKEKTIVFVRELPLLLKRFKTTTVIRTDTHIGEVRGQIDWGQTTKERLSRNYRDRTIFSTNESIRSYSTPENLVLKKLLGILYTILFNDAYIKGFEHAKWFSQWQDVKGNVLYAFKKNIYLQRVEDCQVSDRTIQKTLNHRNKIYRNAAKLLLSYRRLINGDYSENDLKILLRETFIVHEKVDVLFELYWVVQMIKQNSEKSQLHLLDGSQNMVATWESNSHVFNIFHDSTGSAGIHFLVSLNEIENSNNLYLRQKFRSLTSSRELAESIFGKRKERHLWQGRPDIIVEVYQKTTNELVKLFIGEVKNTSKIDYAVTGLEELLEYIHFVKNHKGEYLLDSPTTVQGILCVGDLPYNHDISVDVVRVVNRGKENKLLL
ncbi:hypothetical protein [Neobacillus sp. CF12]|uniref:hypothetical protein n=1 Tax=Neobacillus sp. CF12 TaxID=3055864 RepID=UPI0025A0A4BE|nr:hypothetical protein [Neobacillus sp. CF12]MDM5326835.1 hypothetical protein [Neobacillus sp. CF12]